MDQQMTITQLQQYIKHFDHHPAERHAYFMKLIEEIGELAEVVRKNVRLSETGNIKGTIEEELSDVLYYVLALANVYDIDLAESFKLKDEINKAKWNR